jgi:hypothetical protein
MSTFITLFVILAASYWIITIISRKQKELTEKELYQREQFLKETKSLLKIETPSFVAPIASETIQPSSENNYCSKVTKYLTDQGYSITESVKIEGINLIGLKENELLLGWYESNLTAIKKVDLKIFLADCTAYIESNPMLRGRSLVRFYATNRPITEEAQQYVRENPASLRLVEI